MSTGVPFEKLPWPPDLEKNPEYNELLVQAVMADPTPPYYAAKLEILMALMTDWHNRFNALVDFLEKRDRELTEKIAALEQQLEGLESDYE